MTPKTQPTTLQLARQFIRYEKELGYVDHAIGTLTGALSNPDEIEHVCNLGRIAHENVATEYNHVKREYIARIKKRGDVMNTRMHNHLYDMAEIASEYAWK